MIGALFRLGFVVACSAFVYGLIRLADYESTMVALVVGLVGGGLAVALGEDWSQPAAAPGPRRRRHRPWRRTGPYEGDS